MSPSQHLRRLFGPVVPATANGGRGKPSASSCLHTFPATLAQYYFYHVLFYHALAPGALELQKEHQVEERPLGSRGGVATAHPSYPLCGLATHPSPVLTH